MDKHVRLSNASSEWQEINKMSFWGIYAEKLGIRLNLAKDSKKGVSDKPLEDFRYYLGMRQAFEDILNLPKIILNELRKKADEE